MMKLIRKNTCRKRKELVFSGDWYAICKKYLIKKKYAFWHCVINDEVLSNFSQIGEQIEVIQGVVLPVIPRLNDSAPEK